MLRAAGVLVMVGAAAWYGGVFDGGLFGGGYSREVDRPVAQVVDSIADFDLSDMEGEPGSNPDYAGGASTTFASERTATGWLFTATTGGLVSMRFHADVVDLGEGRSEVRARVERGNSPDERTPRMFTDEGVTLALFGAALDEELAALTLPANFNAVVCGQILARFEQRNMARPRGNGGFAEQVADGQSLASADAELQRAGCSQERMRANREAVQAAMYAAEASATGGSTPTNSNSVNAPRGAHDRALAEAAERRARGSGTPAW